MMSAAEHWWNHLTGNQRYFIYDWIIKHHPEILLKDVQAMAFQKNIFPGWRIEPGFPASEMRII